MDRAHWVVGALPPVESVVLFIQSGGRKLNGGQTRFGRHQGRSASKPPTDH